MIIAILGLHIDLLHVVFENEALQRKQYSVHFHEQSIYIYDDLKIAHRHAFMFNNDCRKDMFSPINYQFTINNINIKRSAHTYNVKPRSQTSMTDP